jgi:hypothetical protein
MSSGPQQAQAQVTQGFTDVMTRAVTDSAFRTQLYANQAAALQGYQLSPNDLKVLNSITPEMMNGYAAHIQQFHPTILHAVAIVFTANPPSQP